MRSLVVVICIIITAVTSEISRKVRIPMCSDETANQFRLTDPGNCKSGKNATRYVYNVDIVKPYNRVKQLAGVACRRQIDMHQCTHYFFGSKSCSLVRTDYIRVDKEECEEAARNHYVSEGSLLPQDEKMMETKNILVQSYRWPVTRTILVKNFQMTPVMIQKDIAKNIFSHVSLGKLTCETTLRTCYAEAWRVNYVENTGNSCSSIPRIRNTTLIIHEMDNGRMYEIREANIVASVLTRCPQDAVECIGNTSARVLCTLAGHILLIPEDCEVKTSDTSQTEAPASLRYISSAIATASNGGLLNVRLLEKYFRKATCEAARASVVALMGSQRNNPSEVLSLLLEREVQAVYTAGALRELKCVPVEAVLQPTLNYKGHVSNRPLFIAYVGTGHVLTSLRQGRYLSTRITSTVTSSRKKAFAFNNSVLIYENATIVDRKPMLQKITLKNLNLDEELFQLDERNLAEDFEQIASSEEDITAQQIKNLITLTKNEYMRRGVNLDEWLSQSHTIDSNLFSEMINNLSQSWSTKMEKALDVLTKGYTVLWTLLTIMVVTQGCKNLITRSCSRNEEVNSEA